MEFLFAAVLCSTDFIRGYQHSISSGLASQPDFFGNGCFGNITNERNGGWAAPAWIDFLFVGNPRPPARAPKQARVPAVADRFSANGLPWTSASLLLGYWRPGLSRLAFPTLGML